MKIPLSKIRTSTPRVRKSQDPEALDQLSASISAFGIAIVPVGVRKNDGHYDLVYGHRRVAAAKQAGLSEIDAIELDAKDDMVAVYGLVENICREGMTPIDIAKALQQIKDESGWSDDRLGKFFGHGKSWVHQHLDLLAPEVSAAVGKSTGAGTFGSDHLTEVKAGLGKGHEADITPVIKKVVKEGLTTRQARQVAGSIAAAKTPERKQQLLKTPFSSQLHDPELVRRAPTIKDFKQERKERHDLTPAVADAIKDIDRQEKVWLQTYLDMYDAGKFSPEGARFVASRLRKFAASVISAAGRLGK